MGPGVGGGGENKERLPSKLAGGRFHVRGILGTGQSGTVVAAWDKLAEQEVAIKLLEPRRVVDVTRFKNEFRRLHRLASCRVVGMRQLILNQPASQDACWCLVMDRVKGETFEQRMGTLRDAGQLEAMHDILAELAAGLSEIHAHGLLHRDLKPENILVDGTQPLVLDFGLAGLLEANESGLIGTPVTMAPEIIRRQPASTASDWYSYGVLLFLALTGHFPHQGTSLEIFQLRAGPEAWRPTAEDFPVAAPPQLIQLCLELLHPTPEERPGAPEVLAAFRRPAPAVRASFVGRERELQALRHCVEEGRPAIVEAPSGGGKSALIARLAESMSDDVLWLRGRCEPRESLPFQLLDSLAEDLAVTLKTWAGELPRLESPRGLIRFFPGLMQVPVIQHAHRDNDNEAGDPRQAQREAATDLTRLISAVLGDAALGICIDDLQWCGSDSALLLKDLSRALVEQKVRHSWLGSRRPLGEVWVDQVPWWTDSAQKIRLAPLAQEEVNSFLGRRVDHGLGSLGDPLLLSLWTKMAAIGSRAPGSLDELLSAAWQGREKDERRLLGLLATAESPLPWRVVARCFPDVAFSAVRKLAASGWVSLSDEWRGISVDLFHDRIRQQIRAWLSSQESQACHQALARSYSEDAIGDAFALAVHWGALGETERAAQAAIRAGDEAAEAFAFGRSCSAYKMAADWAHGHTRGETLAKLSAVLADDARGVDSAECALEASELLPAWRGNELKLRAGRALLDAGRYDRGRNVLTEALRELGVGMPKTPIGAILGGLWHRSRVPAKVRDGSFEMAEAQGGRRGIADATFRASIGFSLMDSGRSFHFHQRHLRAAYESGQRELLDRAMVLEPAFSAARGGAAEVTNLRLIEQLQRTMGDSQDPYLRTVSRVSHGLVIVHLGRFREGARILREASLLSRTSRGTSREVTLGQMYEVAALGMVGDFSTLGQRIEEYLQSARERRNQFALTLLQVGTTTWGLLAEDRPCDAREQTDFAIKPWTDAGYHVQHFLHSQGRADIALYDGDPAWAHERLMGERAAVLSGFIGRAQWARLSFRDSIARASLAVASQAGHRDARSEVKRCAEQSRLMKKESRPWANALSTLLDAGVARVQGREGAARELYAQASLSLDAVDLPLHAAAARVRLAELEGRRADPFSELNVRDAERFTRVLAP